MRYIAFDLEWNSVPPSYILRGLNINKIIKDRVNTLGLNSVIPNPLSHLDSEIIEIGAVKLDDNFQTIDRFQDRIIPVRLPILNPYVAKAISVTQEDLDRGTAFPTVIKNFYDWCSSDSSHFNTTSSDILSAESSATNHAENDSPNETILLTWSNSDNKALRNNLKYYGLDESIPFRTINVQKLFADYIGINEMVSLKKACDFLDIKSTRKYHCAEDDAYYTAKIFQYLLVPLIDTLQNEFGRRLYFDNYKLAFAGKSSLHQLLRENKNFSYPKDKLQVFYPETTNNQGIENINIASKSKHKSVNRQALPVNPCNQTNSDKLDKSQLELSSDIIRVEEPQSELDINVSHFSARPRKSRSTISSEQEQISQGAANQSKSDRDIEIHSNSKIINSRVKYSLSTIIKKIYEQFSKNSNENNSINLDDKLSDMSSASHSISTELKNEENKEASLMVPNSDLKETLLKNEEVHIEKKLLSNISKIRKSEMLSDRDLKRILYYISQDSNLRRKSKYYFSENLSNFPAFSIAHRMNFTCPSCNRKLLSTEPLQLFQYGHMHGKLTCPKHGEFNYSITINSGLVKKDKSKRKLSRKDKMFSISSLSLAKNGALSPKSIVISEKEANNNFKHYKNISSNKHGTQSKLQAENASLYNRRFLLQKDNSNLTIRNYAFTNITRDDYKKGRAELAYWATYTITKREE